MSVLNKKVVSYGAPKNDIVSPPLQTISGESGVCVLARTSTGWENPRPGYEAPASGMILDFRQRQLHDEDKSCGIQPAYIRVINRRLSADVLT